LVGGFFSTHGVHVLSPRRLTKQLSQEPEGEIDIAEMREAIASQFKPA
jgi:hypothetical protein